MRNFEPDPSRAGALVWRQSNARAIGAGVTALLLAGLALGGVVAMIGTLFASFGAIAMAAVLSVLMGLSFLSAALARLCWRQARGQYGLRVELHSDALVLALPGDRSLVHAPAAVARRLVPGSIARVLSREEAFAAQLMAMLQRTYWLELVGGERILLFEDRALRTNYATPSLMPVAQAIAQHLGVPFESLPAVEGQGGLMGAWWTAKPGRDAPAIEPERRALIHRRIALTGVAAAIALAAVVLSMLLS
ncbi:MAG: hypothetical protein R3E87_15840 [Burkholderiaceae bacterium]